MNEEELLQQAAAANQTPEATIQAETAQPEAQAPQQPEFDPVAFAQSLAQQNAQQNQQFQEQMLQQIQQNQQQFYQPTEEEQVVAQVKERLGFNDITQENEQLKSTLQETRQQQEEMMKMFQQQQQFVQRQQFTQQHPNIDQGKIEAYLQELYQVDPEGAQRLNTMQGWNWLVSKHGDMFSNVQQTPPDKHIKTEATGDEFAGDVHAKAMKGQQLDDEEVGMALLSMINS